MKIRNLESEMESIYEKNLLDLESMIHRFAHGECHDVTASITHLYKNVKVGVIFSKVTDQAVHSCVILDNGLTLDAYGINTIDDTTSRYKALTQYQLQEDVVFLEVNDSFFDDYQLEDMPEDILAEYSIILDYINVDLNTLYLKR